MLCLLEELLHHNLYLKRYWQRRRTQKVGKIGSHCLRLHCHHPVTLTAMWPLVQFHYDSADKHSQRCGPLCSFTMILLINIHSDVAPCAVSLWFCRLTFTVMSPLVQFHYDSADKHSQRCGPLCSFTMILLINIHSDVAPCAVSLWFCRLTFTVMWPLVQFHYDSADKHSHDVAPCAVSLWFCRLTFTAMSPLVQFHYDSVD